MLDLLNVFLSFRNAKYAHQKVIRGIRIVSVLLFSISKFIDFIDLGILGIVIATILSFIMALLAFVVFGVIEMVITNIVEKKERQLSRQKWKEDGFTDILSMDEMSNKIQQMNKNIRYIFIAMVIVCFIVFTIVLLNESIIFSCLISVLAAIPFLAILIIMIKKKAPLDKEYKENFEKLIVNKILESVFNVKEFERTKSFDQNIIEDSKIFPDFDHYFGEDYLLAEYKGINFEQSDVNMTKEEEEHYKDREGKDRIRVVNKIVFNGRLIVVDFDTISNDHVYVHDKRIKKMDTVVETEMQEFNNIFSIESKTPQTALQILTPQVIEGIVKASKKLNFPMSVAFKNDKIYIAVRSGNSFEITNMRGETLLQQKERIKRDVQIILDLIDSIYLK